MKLLVVFATAFVLVAHGNVTPSDEEESFYGTKPEVVAGYVVGLASDNAVPQDIFGDEAEPRYDFQTSTELPFYELYETG